MLVVGDTADAETPARMAEAAGRPTRMADDPGSAARAAAVEAGRDLPGDPPLVAVASRAWKVRPWLATAGVDRVLTKPVGPGDLAAVLAVAPGPA